jgi:quaternary ammonium compound-resistance protein SugE
LTPPADGPKSPAEGTTPRFRTLGTARHTIEELPPVPWILLFTAGLLEVVWAFFMKRSAGFSLLVPSVVTIIAMIASFALLAVAMRSLPLGTAYTVWTGIGAVGAFILGVVILGESASPMRLLAAATIVAGIVLMKLSSPS